MQDIRVFVKIPYGEFLELAHSLFKPYKFSRQFADDSSIDYWPVTLAYPQGSIRIFTKNVLYIFESE